MSFMDDLEAVLTGLVATGLPDSDICGLGSQISGTSVLDFNGGLLSANSSCSFDVVLQVPANASDGVYANATNALDANIGGNLLSLSQATDDLIVNSTFIELTKEFTDDPVDPGENVNLEFTLKNLDPSNTISSISFSDNFELSLSGLVANWSSDQ